MADLNLRSEDWPTISRRLDQALALEIDERLAWLESLPESLPIKLAIARLLAGADRVETGEFLERLPTLTLGPDLGDVQAIDLKRSGDIVGPYRLLREIGRGGMASVWLAARADGLLERRVALKLPHVSAGSAALIERMNRERNIVGSLTHPNIARLYDAGLAADGSPFLALEYVEGDSIDVYVDRHAVSVHDRVRLIVQVARAVAYAHGHLVVHRDLKPSNILVNAQGQVHLLDFGIAQLVDRSVDAGHDQASGGPGEDGSVTRRHGRALTPDYAAPEQIKGEQIGTSADVYSLGVVMFELLAGARPYRLARTPDAAKLQDALARVAVPRVSEAASDSATKRLLRGDLDAIVGLAMRKDRQDRYPTMDALADDLERHLRREPVMARPDSPLYRADRWTRRHKPEAVLAVAIAVAVPAGAAAQAAVLLALGAGAGVALWQLRVARRHALTAQLEAAHAEQVKAFALSILEGANTDSGAGAETTAGDVLLSAQARVERELGSRPATAVELMISIGDGLNGLGQVAAAAEILEKAVELGRRALGQRHPLSVAAVIVRCSVLVTLAQTKEAIALLLPAISEARRQGLTHSLVDGLRWLSSAYIAEADVEAGLTAANEAVAVVVEGGDDVRKLDALTAWASLSSALNVAQRDGQTDAARRALACAQELYGDRQTESVLSVRLLLAKGLANEGQHTAALRELESVRADAVRLLGPTHQMMVNIGNFLGHVRLDSGDAQGAIEAFQMQLAAVEKVSGGSGTTLGLTHSALGKAFAAARLDAEAIASYSTSASLLEGANGANNPYALRSTSARALVLTRLGRLEEADAAFSFVDGADWADSDVEKLIHAGRVSVLRTRQGRHDEAVRLARMSLERVQEHPSALVRANASAALGSALLGAELASEAVAPLKDAVRLFAERQIVPTADHLDAVAALATARAALVA
jgi:serine/threonine-protein kinase